MFGQKTDAAAGAPPGPQGSGGGLFGQKPAEQPKTTGLFGAGSAGTAGGASNNAASGGLFGGGAPKAPAFGADKPKTDAPAGLGGLKPTSGGLFGQPKKPDTAS